MPVIMPRFSHRLALKIVLPFAALTLAIGAIGTLTATGELSSRSQQAFDNQLIQIGPGFNIAAANLYMDFQLARGIRVASTIYLSSKHHNETWVKDGYIQIDGSPFKNELLDKIFERVTVKIGHMEINYGDTHFRRSDNAAAQYNPLVGNLLMDAFSTQVGTELYYHDPSGFFGMLGITSGELNSTVTNPNSRDYAFNYKLGFDKQIAKELRAT